MRIRQAAIETIVAHARRDAPRECCGLLIGTDIEVTEVVPASNEAGDPLRRYEVSPIEHLAQIRRCREVAKTTGVNVGVVGAYHSHPRSAPEPSPTDREQAFEDFLYVIAGPVGGGLSLDVRAYRLRNGHFEAVELIVDERPEAASPPATTR
jgi:proteasome lid subunit RPN8/RPN11